MSNFDEKTVDRIKRLEREVERLRVKESPGAWTSWTPSSQEGWTAIPSGSYRYSQVGKLVYCMIAITAGTSNGVTAKIALPVPPANSLSRGTWGWGMDNGTQVNPAGGWLISSSTNTINFFKTSIDGATWTNSGTKRIHCVFFYEAA